VQGQRHRGRLVHQRPNAGDDVLGADWDEDAEFAQQASDGIEPRGPRREPGRPETVQRGHGLVLDRLDRDRVDLLVPIGFQEPFRVGAVGLIAPHVRAHIMRGE
jgi:hypothetical protein